MCTVVPHFTKKDEAQLFSSWCEETSIHLENYPGSTFKQDWQFVNGRFMNFGENKEWFFFPWVHLITKPKLNERGVCEVHLFSFPWKNLT